MRGAAAHGERAPSPQGAWRLCGSLRLCASRYRLLRERLSGPARRTVPATLALALALAACGGSAVPYTPPAGDADAAPPRADVALDVGGPDAPQDAGADVCSCAPEDPCTPATPACTPPECAADEDCRDDDVCTADRCDPLAGSCVNEPVPGCCANDADCDDGVDCTLDRCQGKECQHEAVGDGCCATAADCDDGFPDTLDRCARNRCVHALDDPPAPCAAVGECPADNACVAAACVSDLCSYSPVAGARCCTTRDDCVDDDVCTDDFCVEFRCIYTLSPQPQPQVSWTFDDGAPPAGFDLGEPAGGAAWHVTEAAAWSQPASLRAGAPDGAGYGGAGPFSITVETAPVPLPVGGPVTLRFRTLLDIEPDPADRATVSVVPAGGAAEVVWTGAPDGGDPGGAWPLQTASLTPYAGQTVALRLVFTSNGAPSPERTGWFVDDVELVYRCDRPQE